MYLDNQRTESARGDVPERLSLVHVCAMGRPVVPSFSKRFSSVHESLDRDPEWITCVGTVRGSTVIPNAMRVYLDHS